MPYKGVDWGEEAAPLFSFPYLRGTVTCHEGTGKEGRKERRQMEERKKEDEARRFGWILDT